jgi:GNAT superfamily N-acetyltransferase
VVTVRPIAGTPHVAEVARWLHAEWWATEGWSLAATEAFLRAAAGPAAPISFVAEAEGRPLGTATLDMDDLLTRPDLAPWLASVLVAPAARGRGLGSRLAAHVEAAAAALGHTRIYLHTMDRAGFYAARGWRVIGQDAWCGQPTVLMTKEVRTVALPG